MNIHVTDQNGNALAGVALKVTGYLSVSPWTFDQTVTTDSNGDATLEDIRYSTSLEPYFIQLVTPHNPPLALPSGVTAPTVDSSFLPLASGVIPVILNPGQTQDVQLVVSTGPAVSSLSPAGGSMFGGTIVVITGNNFTGATAVKFGSSDAASFTVNSATRITAVAPAGTGTVDVTVTTPQGTSAAWNADQYSYQLAAPTVTSREPHQRHQDRRHHGHHPRDQLRRDYGRPVRHARCRQLHGRLHHTDHGHLSVRRHRHGGHHGDHGRRHLGHLERRPLHLHHPQLRRMGYDGASSHRSSEGGCAAPQASR